MGVLKEQNVGKAKNNKLLSKEQEIVLLRRYALLRSDPKKNFDEIQEIESKLLNANIKAAYSVAYLLTKNIPYVDKEDAIQEACWGILEAIRKYDLSKTTDQGQPIKFITYAYTLAESRVKNFIENSRLIQLPKTRIEKILTVFRSYQASPTPPSMTALLSKTNRILKSKNKDTINFKQLIEIITSAQNPISLNASIFFNNSNKNSSGNSLADRIPSMSKTVEEELITQEKSTELKTLLKNFLSPIEYEIIELKYLEGKIRTLKEIKTLLSTSFSTERIRQIEKQAISNIQNDSLAMASFKKFITLYGE